MVLTSESRATNQHDSVHQCVDGGRPRIPAWNADRPEPFLAAIYQIIAELMLVASTDIRAILVFCGARSLFRPSQNDCGVLIIFFLK